MNHYKNIFCADFETVVEETNYYKNNNRTDIVYGYIKSLDGIKDYEFISLDDFFKYFENQTAKYITVYFHNLFFDGTFILDYLDDLGFVADYTTLKPFTFNVFRSTNSRIYYFTVNWNNKIITFKCSKLLLSSSIKQLGKNINLDKYIGNQEEDENFYIVEPEKSLIEFKNKNTDYCLYCQRDVEIMRISLLSFFDEMYNILKQKNIKELDETFKKLLSKPTISSVSFFLQQLLTPNNIKQLDPFYIYEYHEKEKADKFKQGGLTLTNKKYVKKQIKTKKDGYVIDLKSAYPAAMNNEKIAFRLIAEIENKSFDEIKKIYEKYNNDYDLFCEVDITNIKANNHEIPLLKNFSENKKTPYYLEVDNYHAFYEFEELLLLLKLFKYESILFKKVYFVKKERLFLKFVTDFFDKKEYHKKNNDLAKSHTFKILLNSGYGVHCKKWDYLTVSHVFPENVIMELKKDKKFLYKNNIDLNKPTHLCYLKNNAFYAYKPIEPEKFAPFNNVWIANSITSHTRKKLLKAIIDFGPDNVVYTDTDSLFLINVDIKKVLNYSGKNLGDWEIEKKKFNEFYIMRSKFYELKENNKIVKSGTAGFKLDRSIVNIKKDEKLKSGLVPVRVPGGLILKNVEKVIKNFNYEYKINENQVRIKEKDKLIEEIKKAIKKWKNET